MTATQQVPDISKIGKKGMPMHFEAFGIELPTKIVPVEGDEPAIDRPGLNPVDVYRLEIQTMIDAKASERQYDSGATLASYVNSTITEWAMEAQAFVAWRDAVWLHALAELDKVKNGEREQPTVADFVAELPEFNWSVE